jgi:hypothetical protein
MATPSSLVRSGCLAVFLAFSALAVPATEYFISSSEGDDGNDGLSALTPFASLAMVDTLNLAPGDRVQLKCGDRWRAEQLRVNAVGALGDPVVFGSYPAGCADRPVLSGALPITGWSIDSGNIWVADLSTGANAGSFPFGITQLFRSDTRLPCGRWPNLGTGYAFVDAAPAGNQLTDAALPAADWGGAVLRIKTQRWLLVNREVVGSSGNTLTLNEAVDCRGGTCAGWGYFLQNHRAALDEEGEWSFDGDTNRVYLYSSSGPPSGITGSVVLDDDPVHHGGVMILADAEHVAVENLEITQWWANGIGAQASMPGDVYHHVTVRDSEITDVDAAAVRLSTWVWGALNGRDGLRGGRNMAFLGNRIEGSNHFGITGYFSDTLIEDNDISGIGLIANLNITGMGCGTTGASCTENGDGVRIRSYLVEDSGHHNQVRLNRISRTGYNAVDVFGPYAGVELNHIVEPCFSKGDCGGVRVFGDTSLAATKVHDITLRSNIIVDSVGNVDGVHIDYRQPFGMGLYIDHYSRDVESVDNTIVNSTFTGLLYQNSTGTITGNTMHNNATGIYYTGQVNLAGSVTHVSSMTGNVLYGLTENAWTLALDGGSLAGSDHNYFFHPFVPEQITTGGWAGRKTFPEWQVWSGQDASSRDNWFVLAAGDPPLSTVFTNPTTSTVNVSLDPRRYLDLDQNPVSGVLVLPPFGSRVLIDDGPADAIFADDFESGGLNRWSSAAP